MTVATRPINLEHFPIWHADGTQGPHPGICTSFLAIEGVPESTPTQFLSAVSAAQGI
jgi:hypothetical protein